MPYNDSQAVEYGELFNSWTEDDFSRFVGSLIASIPLSALTLVVSIVLCFLLLQVHHSENQASFVRRWLTTSSFKPVIPMFMVKYGKLFIRLLIFQLDAFSMNNLMACPAVETFTLATKVPKGRGIHHSPAPRSRLEFQTRTNVVYVQTNRKPYVDEKKRVSLISLLLLLFSEGQSK